MMNLGWEIVMEPSDWPHPFSEPQKITEAFQPCPLIHCSSSMATSRHSRYYKVPSLSAPLLSCVLVNLAEFSLSEFLENIFRGSVYHSLYFLVFLRFINAFSHFTLVVFKLIAEGRRAACHSFRGLHG